MVLQKGYTPHLALHPPATGYPGISQLEPLCEPTLDITIAIPVTFLKKDQIPWVFQAYDCAIVNAGDSVSSRVYNGDFIFLPYHFPIVALTKDPNEVAETAETYQPPVLRFEIQDQGICPQGSCAQLCLPPALKD